MHNWDLLLTDVRIATMRQCASPYGVIEDGALAVAGGRIAWVGQEADLPSNSARETQSLSGTWLTPGLIDCHTHLVFAGNRAAEFEQRLAGSTYAEIAAAGGGIMATVRATRAASREQLATASTLRLEALASEGVTTVEIKSGYGLDTATECRMLEVARDIGSNLGVSVETTFLGAHAVPTDWRKSADDYLMLVCEEMLPRICEDGLANAVDAYCETIAFSPQQVRRLFERARDLGMPVKLHADQLSDSGGAALAAEFAALSADHLEYTTDESVAAMAEAGTVAVLLPGAYLTLGEHKLPPISALRESGVPIAVASDLNPGTSPYCSLRAAMHLATSAFALTPAECLAGVTREAARALGLLEDRGTLEVGKRADLLAWSIEHPAELSYWLGLHRPVHRWLAGRMQAG